MEPNGLRWIFRMFVFRKCFDKNPNFNIFLNFCRGKCPHCEKSLTRSAITEEEFKLVRHNFEAKVVRGVDLYHKTTPDEWNAFMKLIEEQGPFDIVLDGLNVSFKSNYGSIEQQIGRARADYNSVSNRCKSIKYVKRKHFQNNLFLCSLSTL